MQWIISQYEKNTAQQWRGAFSYSFQRFRTSLSAHFPQYWRHIVFFLFLARKPRPRWVPTFLFAGFFLGKKRHREVKLKFSTLFRSDLVISRRAFLAFAHIYQRIKLSRRETRSFAGAKGSRVRKHALIIAKLFAFFHQKRNAKNTHTHTDEFKTVRSERAGLLLADAASAFLPARNPGFHSNLSS